MTDLTIVIVDDSEADRYMLSLLLKRTDYEVNVLEYAAPREALESLRDPDSPTGPQPLIFLDLNMPIMSGFEFLDEFALLRATTEHLTDSCVTVLTNSDDEDDMRRATTYPFVVSHVIKMPEPAALSNLIRDALQLRELQRRRREQRASSATGG